MALIVLLSLSLCRCGDTEVFFLVGGTGDTWRVGMTGVASGSKPSMVHESKVVGASGSNPKTGQVLVEVSRSSKV